MGTLARTDVEFAPRSPVIAPLPAAAGKSIALQPLHQPMLAPAGKLLMGHAGVQAADEVTDVAKVRVLTPGNEVKELGTLRVLVIT